MRVKGRAGDLLEGPPLLAGGLAVRELSPWTHGEYRLAPTARPASFGASFTRMMELDPARLDSLPEWWHRRARDERVDIAHRLLLQEPRREDLGTWCIRGSLRNPWRRRSMSVELRLWPRLDAWTRMTVEPQRGVRVGRRYFASGHRVLDVLCDQLVRELPS